MLTRAHSTSVVAPPARPAHQKAHQTRSLPHAAEATTGAPSQGFFRNDFSFSSTARPSSLLPFAISVWPRR
jgi:hypothetical protein